MLNPPVNNNWEKQELVTQGCSAYARCRPLSRGSSQEALPFPLQERVSHVLSAIVTHRSSAIRALILIPTVNYVIQ
jgi:hypothetical protein